MDFMRQISFGCEYPVVSARCHHGTFMAAGGEDIARCRIPLSSGVRLDAIQA